MGDELADLLADVERARRDYLAVVAGLSPEAAAFAPAPAVWSAVENTEHLVRAELGGVNGMWTALERFLAGDPVWTGEAPHAGKSIETVIAQTWREREDVPPVAAPTWGGSLGFWVAALQANRSTLEALAGRLQGVDLGRVLYPHPISGPLDVRQRFGFLRFHLDRHRGQVERLLVEPGFPRT